jgi:hypothetical protein
MSVPGTAISHLGLPPAAQQVHAFNCLRCVFNDAALALDTSGFHAAGVAAAIRGMAADAWEVRACHTLLFSYYLNGWCRLLHGSASATAVRQTPGRCMHRHSCNCLMQPVRLLCLCYMYGWCHLRHGGSCHLGHNGRRLGEFGYLCAVYIGRTCMSV